MPNALHVHASSDAGDCRDAYERPPAAHHTGASHCLTNSQRSSSRASACHETAQSAAR
jgi:hypothetical protein